VHYRHGDVIIERVTSVPHSTTLVPRDQHGRIILAAGEATGHHHTIADREAEFVRTETDERFLRVMAASGVTLVHEEHAAITLPPGDYRIKIQREYQPNALPRRVVD